jgi:PAS domain S-box-containing protein
MTEQAQALPSVVWPVGGGELGRLMRDRDWRELGFVEPAGWPRALRSVIEIILPADVQIVLFWGEDYRAFYNDTYAPTIGDKHPAALGRPAHQYWSELWDDLKPLLDRVRTTGETYSARDRPFQIERSGYMEDVFFDISYSPVRGESGAVEGVLCIVNETTDHIVARRQLNMAQTAGRAGIFEWFPDNDEIKVSESYRSIYGFPAEGPALSDDFLARMHPDDRALSTQLRVGAGADPIGYVEFRIHRADTGEERWVSRRGEMIYPVDGRPRFIGVAVDITDRKRAEEALVRLNASLESEVAERTRERDWAWRLSQDLIVALDERGILTAVNPAWTTRLGYELSELEKLHYSQIIHPEEVETTGAVIGQALQAPVSNYEVRLRHKRGDFRWFSWNAAPDGRGLVYATGRDITEQKEAAEALARTEEQLRQAQKMEAVGQLTGGIAHDFNNLLQGITGSLDLIRKRIADGRVAEIDRFIAGALTSAERASALTHRLLAFARRQPLDPRPIKVNPLVATMEDLLRRTLGERVELELVLAGGLWTTLCDANQLESAILNLAINARDAMSAKGEGFGKLTIETCNAHLDNAYAARDRDVRPGQYVCISVSDTGSGMTAEVMSRAFDPFFTTKPLGQGTGLGLSMIYGFARQSEGSVKLYSEIGKGTTVKLYLPRHRGPADKAGVEAAPEDDVEGAYGEETVLVVEDEPIVRGLIVDVLNELGYRTLEAADGLEGLKVLKSDRRIDLLITDIGLPGLNGRQMTEASRGIRPGLKVLFMTGYAENAALASGFLEPGMEMITKPFAMDALGRRIADMLRRP